MKKIMAVFLCVVLLCSGLPLVAFAKPETPTPFIVLQGYSGPRLDNAQTGEQVWGLDFNKVKDRIVAALPKIAGTAGAVFVGDTTQLVDILGEILLETMEPIACNADGSSKHPVVPHFRTAQDCRVSTMRAKGETDYIAEKELVQMLEEKVGAENVFIFNFDWRQGQIAYANAIDAFIQEVKALTGAKQVDIFGLSHGGQCGASYLYYHGQKGDVRKIVLDAPAIGGTTMVGDPLLGNPLHLDFATILEFVELALGTESEFEWLIRYIGFENLNAVLTDLCARYIVDFIKNVPSIWDFCPLAVYETAKEKRLDPIENAEIIRNSDAFHYDAMQNMAEGLRRAQKAGVQIAILANYGHENVTGSQKNSDYIIDTATASGAFCAPFGEQFSETYTQKGENCGNGGHLHISPERNVDASTAYLPDNTWFINGQFHGMYVFDPYTVSLLQCFYFTDGLRDVFSDPRFPQFNSAQNPVDSLYIRFDATAPGYHSAADRKLLVKNLSAKYPIAVRYIAVNGAELSLTPDLQTRIQPGETGYFTLPAHSLTDCQTPFDITVVFTLYNEQLLLKKKTFTFTPLSAQDVAQYRYLTAAAALPADDKDLGKAPSADNSTQPTAPAEEVQPTVLQNEIPKTDGNPRTIPSLLMVPAAAALSFLLCAARKRRTQDAEQ